jgi:hypothetical protein
MDDNPNLWEMFRWSAVGINFVIGLVSVLFFLQYWWRGVVTFPRVNKPMIAQVFLFLSAVVQSVSFSIDPYRFYSYAGGWLTSPLNTGLIFFNALSLPLLLCAYAFLTAFWVTLRSKEPRESPEAWSTWGTVAYYTMAIGGMLSAPVAAIVWHFTHTIHMDKLYFGWMGAFSGVMCVILAVTTLSTLKDLKQFSTKNAELSKSVARHALAMGLVFTSAVVALIITLAAAKDTFGGFFGGRNIAPYLIGTVVRVALAIYYKHKRKYGGKPQPGKRGTVLVDVKSYAAVYEPLIEKDEADGGDSQGVYREGGF